VPGGRGHVLATKRLVLCPVTTDDHAALLALWTMAQVRRFLFDGAFVSAAEITAAIEDSARGFAAAGYALWLIRDRDGTELAGAIGLRPLENLGLEVYYSPAPGRWGNGFATKAARAVVEYGLGPLGLAEVDEGNAASVAVIRRLGMTSFEAVPGLLGPMTCYRITR